MPDSYWFASVLIDSDGHWRGRFIRPNPPGAGRDAPVSWLLKALADAAADDNPAGLCFLPSDLLADGNTPDLIGWSRASAPCVWLGDGGRTAGGARFAAYRAADSAAADLPLPATCIRVVVDSGASPRWQFPVGNALADVSHLRHRKPPSGAEPERAKPHLLNLLTLVTRDAETHELEKAFRIDPELSYHLLRLVNSVGMGLTHHVKSLSHAITVVGRRQLQRWLQLLIYVNTKADRARPNPLLQVAAYRGRLLELLATPGKDPDSAYMIGIFSLLDRILPGRMSEIIAKLPIHASVREALCERSGPLGKLLACVEAAEIGQFDEAVAGLAAFDIEPQKWLRSQNEAYNFAHAIGRELTRPNRQ